MIPPDIHVHVAQPPAQQQGMQPERIIIHGSPHPDTRPEKIRTEPESGKRYDPETLDPICNPPMVQRIAEPPTQQKELTPNNKKSYPEPTKTIVPEPENNCESIDKQLPPSIDAQLFEPTKEPDKHAPQASSEPFKKVGQIAGRQRRYDEMGLNDIEPVREVFLLMYLTGQDWPDMSAPMKRYYRKMYFTKPKRGSKDYATHKGCWERREQWIREHTAGT